MGWLGFEPITYDFDLLFFYLDTLIKNYVASEPHFFLIESTLFEIGI